MLGAMCKNSILRALLLILVSTLGLDACAVRCKVAQIDDTVSLQGRIFTKVFPGPPNYININRGDVAEHARLLRLSVPLCVDVGSAGEKRGAVSRMRNIQLVFLTENTKSPVDTNNKSVCVHGTLFLGQSGHHRTPALIEVSRLAKAC